MSFQVKSGEKLAIMGATGAGKSTLLQLIPRFYEVTQGRILVEGQDVQHWELQELREIIGYVLSSHCYLPEVLQIMYGGEIHRLKWMLYYRLQCRHKYMHLLKIFQMVTIPRLGKKELIYQGTETKAIHS